MSANQTRFYRHYKNKPYKYIGVVRHSETLEEMALYETLYTNELGTLWVRPKDMFFEDIELNGVKRPRFEKINFQFIETDRLSDKQFSDVAAVYETCFKKPLKLDKFKSVIEFHTRLFHVLAYENQKLVGFKLGFARDNTRFYSWSGAVLPDYQKLGLAGTMMQRQHLWCAQNKFNIVETRTRNEFSGMIRLNLKNGFKIVGTTIDSAGDRIKLILEKELK